MPDLPAILNAIRYLPDEERHWHTLAGWLWDNGRHDDAVVGVFWTTHRDDVVAGRSIVEVLDQLSRNGWLVI